MRHILSVRLVLAATLSVHLSLALSVPCGSAGEPGLPSPPAEKTTKELIEQLGSKSFEAREQATRLLMDREDAFPALREALKSSDSEVARRASEILKDLTRRQDRRALERLAALARNGKVDQVAECLVRRQKWGEQEDASWQVVAELAAKVLELETKDFHKVHIKDPKNVPFYDFRKFKTTFLPDEIASRQPVIRQLGPYLVRGEEVAAATDTGGSLIVSTGPVRTRRFHSGVILAGDSVEVEGVHTVVIICDGDFKTRDGELERPGGLFDCVVIARGVVHCPEHMNNCVIISGGTVHVPKKAKESMTNTVIRENEAMPLGFVKFFDPAEVGITVVAAESGVRVKEAKEGKPFARAGLRSGDVLLAVDGIATSSPEVFRKVLRRKLAEGGEAQFKVSRSGKVLEIPVLCKD